MSTRAFTIVKAACKNLDEIDPSSPDSVQPLSSSEESWEQYFLEPLSDLRLPIFAFYSRLKTNSKGSFLIIRCLLQI